MAASIRVHRIEISLPLLHVKGGASLGVEGITFIAFPSWL